MSKSNDQDGRQPASEQAAPPTDSRHKNSASREQKLCRDFVWGICLMGGQCKYKHELEFEFMKSTLKFCHDFQNRQGCFRRDCTYLHASQEEQKKFLSNGVIPRVLTERYKTMSSLPKSTDQSVVASTSKNATQPQAPTAPTTGGARCAPLPVSMETLLMPPPPPPPPTTSTTPARPTPPLYTAPPPLTPTTPAGPPGGPHPISHPPPALPPSYDPSRPPPPLPANIPPSNSLKRLAAPNNEVETPCKARKTDGSNENACENCMQQKLRLELYKQEMERLQQVEEHERMVLEKLTEDFENGKLLMRTVVDPSMFRVLDDYVEINGSSPSSQMSMFTTPPPAIPQRQSHLHLVDYVFGSTSSTNILDSGSSTQDEINLLLSLARSSSTVNSTSADPRQHLLELLRPAMSGGAERTSPLAVRAVEAELSAAGPSAGSNGLTRLMNGQRPESVPPPPPAAARLPAPSTPVPARFPPPTPGPVRPFASPPDGMPPAAAPVAYMPYPPPPLNRPYYAYPYPAGPPNAVTAPFAPPGGQPQRHAPPTQGPPPNYQQFMGRFPPPPFQ